MNFIRGLLFDNLGLKLVALLLAVLVYVNVYTDRPATLIVTFPIQVADLPDSLSLSGPAPAAVQAELRGTGKQLIGLRLKEPTLKLSLAAVGRGRYERAVGAEDLPLPKGEGIEVERMLGPRMVELEIARRVTRRLPVAARVEGVPASGYVWPGVVFTQPGSLAVSGPEGTVTEMDSLRLGAARIDGRRDTVHALVGPENLPDWCTADPPRVSVIVPLRRQRP